MFNVNKFLPMTGFKLQTSGIRSDCSTNWFATTANFSIFTSTDCNSCSWSEQAFKAKWLKFFQNFEIIYESNDVSSGFGSLPPAPGSNRSLDSAPGSCPCNQILISSLGQAQHVQSGTF